MGRRSGRVRSWLQRVWRGLHPGDGFRQGVAWAAWAVLVGTALLAGSMLPVGFGPWLDFVAGVALYLAVAGVVTLVAAVAARLMGLVIQAVSWRAFLLLAAGLGTVLVVSGPALIVVLPVVLPVLVLGAVLGAALDGQWSERSWWSRGALLTAGIVAVVGLGWVIVTMAGQGSTDHLAEVPADPVVVEPLDADDPSQPGPYAVQSLTYGSGEDLRRSEFGAEADLVTEPVDGSAFVKGSTGWQMRLRAWYWGFDEEAMPINGRVWYPAGDGPFPLVLIVHGNHGMEESSDPGYEWLGRLLASRGFLFVSVDENFLNGSFRGSPSRENDARGWMLLQHLRVWQRWSTAAEGPFAGRVDMQRVALIGHSRGGEAVAIAAAFNHLEHYPDDATVDLPHGFGIRSVVAIAPSDGQYRPMDRPTPLRGVSYLTLQGGHDADVSVFMGARQWRRTELEAGQFKASVWAYRANHGQFNTVWGNTDFSWPFSRLLNLAPLHSGPDQRQIGGVVMSAFLEATLHDRDEYRRLFRDLRRARSWLPEDVYITRFEDSSFEPLADFEGDIDVTTGRPGVRISGRDLAIWREEQLALRGHGSKRNGVAVVGWRCQKTTDEGESTAQADPLYELRLDQSVRDALQPSISTILVVNLADTGDDPPHDEESDAGDEDHAENDDEGEPDDDADDDPDDEQPLDLSIELEDTSGVTVRRALSEFRQLMPAVESRMTKLPDESQLYGSAWETTLQTFELPLARFVTGEQAFDPAQLSAIRLVFDRSDEGVIVVDDVALAAGGQQSGR